MAYTHQHIREEMFYFCIFLILFQVSRWSYRWLFNAFKPYIIYIINIICVIYVTLFLYLICYSIGFSPLSILIAGLFNPSFYLYSFFITVPVLYSNINSGRSIEPEYLEDWDGKPVPIYDTIKDGSGRTLRPFCIESPNALRKVCCLSLPRHKSKVVAPSDSIFYEIAVGLLLGDGAIFMASGPRSQGLTNCTAYLMIRQVIRNGELTNWIGNYWFSLRVGGCSFNSHVLRGYTTFGVSYTYVARTFAFDWLVPVREVWYPNNGIKRIPQNIELTSLVLAIWFMGDGSLRGYGYALATHSFLIEDIELLIYSLKTQHGIISTFQKNKTEKNTNKPLYHIYIHSQSAAAFADLVRPHMLSTFMYKLGKRA